jgi:hypothetical protein
VVFLHIFQLLERILLLLDSLEFDLLRLQLREEVVAGRVEGGEGHQVLLTLELMEQIRVEFLGKWIELTKNNVKQKREKTIS